MQRKRFNLVVLFWLAVILLNAQEDQIVAITNGELLFLEPLSATLTYVTDLDVPPDTRFDNLVFAGDSCRFFTIQEGVTEPGLATIDLNGKHNYIGRLTLPGEQVRMCEALAYNPVDKKLYGSVSLDGNAAEGDFFSETLVTIDTATAICQYVSTLERNSTYQTDIDRMDFIGNTLYLADARPTTRTGYYSIDLSNLQDPFIPTEREITSLIPIRDITNIDDQLYFSTSDRALYNWNSITYNVSLIGSTHSAQEYDGSAIIGMEYVAAINKDACDDCQDQADQLEKDIEVTICDNDVYEYKGVIYFLETDTTLIIAGEPCDTMVNLKVKVSTSYDIVTELEVCEGEQTEFLGVLMGAGDLEIFNLITEDGCDSTIVVQAEEVEFREGRKDINICMGESYTFNGINYVSAIDTIITIPSFPCDSVISLSISQSELDLDFGVSTESACDGLSNGRIVLGDTTVTSAYSSSLDSIEFSFNSIYENLATGDYTIYLKDSLECSFQLEATVDEFNSVEVLKSIYIPNAFNNNSSIPEDRCFKIFPSPELIILEYELQIFDRWGSEVFSTSDYNDCWRGDIDNILFEQGVYCWLLEMTVDQCTTQETIQFSGSVTQIR